MLKLYYGSGTCALASLIAIEEAGLAYEPVRLNLKESAQRSPDYLSINPKGRVPALVTDRGVVSETPAILAYIAQIAPEAHIAPLDDPFAFARMQAFNNYLSSTVHVNHAHGPRAGRWTDDAAAMETMKAKVPQTMAESFMLIEEHMLAGPWVMGDDYSVADGYLFTMARWLANDKVDIARFPTGNALSERMHASPALQRALAVEHG